MDEVAKKTALRMITYGLYVVGVKRGDELNAFTANWLTQASFKPPLVVVGVRAESNSCAMIKESGVFAVSILGKDQKDLAEHFFSPQHRVGNKLGEVEFKKASTGAPILTAALAFFECRVVDAVERGDHTIFVGEVVEAGVHREGEPLDLRSTGWDYGG